MPSYVIVGASRGIGLEFVKQLSSKSDNQVFAVARNPAGSTTLAEFQKSAPNVHIVKGDMVDPESLKAAADAVAAKTGGSLDYLINNAAVREDESYPLSGFPNPKLLEKNLLEVFTADVIGVAHSTNAFLPLLRKGAAKKIITLSSGLAEVDFNLTTEVTSHPAYAIAKTALNMLVARYANELRPDGFVVLAISPGLVDTSGTALEPPTEEDIKGFVEMVKMFKKAAPHWDGKPISPTASVKAMLGVIDKLRPEDTGKFVSHFGNTTWL